MFLFAADSSNLRPKRLTEFTGAFGNAQCVRNESAVLVWTDDGFTEYEQRGNLSVVGLRRPSLDQNPLVQLEWNTWSKTVFCRRSWSGEFAAWYRREPSLIVTSHLKLAAFLVRDFDVLWKRLEPEHTISTSLGVAARQSGPVVVDDFRCCIQGFKWTYADLTRDVREMVLRSVRGYPRDVALLLSGGLDSSILAASAVRLGKRVTAYALSLPASVRPPGADDDLTAARRTAVEFSIPLVEIRVSPSRVVADTPLGVYLAETSRGTFVDDTPLLVAAARELRKEGLSSVWMGEGADDLFGGFKFAFRYYRGDELARYFRSQLRFDLPNELAMIQNVFMAWGISVVQPFLSRDLFDVGYALPLELRVDKRRVMKQVLRDAFAQDLPSWIVQRTKIATRDGTGARNVLAERYGTAPNRYRSLFRRVLGGGSQWHKELLRIPKT